MKVIALHLPVIVDRVDDDLARSGRLSFARGREERLACALAAVVDPDFVLRSASAHVQHHKDAQSADFTGDASDQARVAQGRGTDGNLLAAEPNDPPGLLDGLDATSVAQRHT